MKKRYWAKTQEKQSCTGLSGSSRSLYYSSFFSRLEFWWKEKCWEPRNGHGCRSWMEEAIRVNVRYQKGPLQRDFETLGHCVLPCRSWRTFNAFSALGRKPKSLCPWIGKPGPNACSVVPGQRWERVVDANNLNPNAGSLPFKTWPQHIFSLKCYLFLTYYYYYYCYVLFFIYFFWFFETRTESV